MQTRIIAYYEQLLAIQARPAYQKPAWKPERPAAPAGDAARLLDSDQRRLDATSPASWRSAAASHSGEGRLAYWL